MLRVIVENLAQNALRYAGPGRDAHDHRRPGASCVLADDGAGVSEEDLPRLFERFFRADRVRGVAGNGSRAGDRETHGHRRRRHGGGGGRAGPRLDHHVRVPGALGPFTTSTPDVHHIQTSAGPSNSLRCARRRRRVSWPARLRARRLRPGAPVRPAARGGHDGGRRGSARRLRGGSALRAGSPLDGSSTVAPLMTLAAERFRKQRARREGHRRHFGNRRRLRALLSPARPTFRTPPRPIRGRRGRRLREERHRSFPSSRSQTTGSPSS